MKYIYDIVLHNAVDVPISKACILADIIEEHLNDDNCHVQAVGLGSNSTEVKITIETIFKLDDLFNVIYDNRNKLKYKDFSIYYSEGFSEVGQRGYAM